MFYECFSLPWYVSFFFGFVATRPCHTYVLLFFHFNYIQNTIEKDRLKKKINQINRSIDFGFRVEK